MTGKQFFVMVWLVMLCGCQWSAYNSVTVDPNDGVVQRVGIGTIEFMVMESKKGLRVETWEGTTVNLDATSTDPDEEMMRELNEILEKLMLLAP